MKSHTIDGASILDWDSFHDVFSKELGFPDYYGRNMDAWINCMSDLDGPISLLINNVKELKDKNQSIYEALIECSAFTNWRNTIRGDDPIIALSFYA